jgi:hypothetical protein
MKLQWLHSPIRWKDSISKSFAILAIIETILAVSGVSLDGIWGKYVWIIRLLLVLILFILLTVLTFICLYYINKERVSLKIRGIKVNIEIGDIFHADGLKVIAFNEYFDTTVDDVIIAHHSLNGKFIDNYIDNDIESLKSTITEAKDTATLKTTTRNGRSVYPLGRIIPYKDFLLLAFTHFDDDNQAHLTQKDYEDCLRVMWSEICRVYANRPVFIPLLGSGITRFDGTPHKSNFELLRCMLCTLRTSSVNIKKPITILLTEEAMSEINIYEIKGVK